MISTTVSPVGSGRRLPGVLTVGKFVPPPYGGIESHVDVLLKSLSDEYVCTLLAASATQYDPDAICGYAVKAVRSYGLFASVPLAPSFFFEAMRLLGSVNCELVHVHVPNPWADLILSLAKRRDLPTVMTWHSDIVRQRRLYRFYRPFQRIALASADRIIVPTPKHFDSSNQLTGIGVDAKIRYIPLGIDFDKLHATPSEPLSASSEQLLIGRRIVFSVGRHVSYKGYSYLVRAARFLPKEVVVVIAGEGPLTPQLKQLANELESDARVVFPGRLSQGQLVGLFRRCSVFTLPSITQAEAFGLATAEAMSFGKPAIVCQLANGVNYLNRHGYTGLTVPPMHPIALADAIQTLVSNESLSTQLGHQAREWVIKQFSVEVMRQGMHSLYKELL